MPEYPDITIYIERLEAFIKGRAIQKIRVISPFVLRTFDPPLKTLEGSKVFSLQRMGKRIVFGFPEEHYLVLHLMISGRLYWKESQAKLNKKNGLASLDFEHGSLHLTEVATKKRASLHLVQGVDALGEFDRQGLEVLDADFAAFRERLSARNHTLKRSLTDPSILSGIGNAYSDEILHRAGLSPILQSQKMDEAQIEKLFHAIHEVLPEWTERLRAEVGEGFPGKVTAFHKAMAVHGKYGEPCPVCQTPIQRIKYASNETNYCPHCQTGGKVLADRGMSRLLKKDWPRTIEELETRPIGPKK